jgi:hypothetical protein
MAANTVSMYGAVAGGDVSSLVGEIGRLRGLTKLSGNSMSDVLALHGFLTGELGVAGEQATTTESNLLARMATRDITVGEGKQAKTITLKADNSLDRFVELLQRIQQGEFGKTREDMAKAIASVTGSLGRESASALLAITAMGAAPERLSRARRMVNEGMSAKGSLTQQSLDRAKRLAPSVEITRKQRKGQRQKDEAGQRDVQGAMRENAAQRLVNMKEAYEVIDPLEDPEAKTTAIRDVVSQMRGESPLEYERRERLRLMKSMFGGTDLPRQHGVRHAYTVQGVQLAALQQGTVQAEGGLSRREGTLLAESGISNEAVQKLSDQGAKATTKAQREAFAEAVSAAVQQAIRNLEQRPNPEANLAAWRKAVDKVIAFSQEIQSGTDQRTVEAWGKQGIAEEQNPEQWAREQQVMLFRDVVRERAMNPRTRARQKEVLGQYGNVVEAGDQRDIARAKTAQDVGLAAFRAGTVDLSDGMDKIERAVLSAMGASEQRLAEIEQRLAEGQTKAVQEAVAKLVEALQARQNAVPQAPRSQEVD